MSGLIECGMVGILRTYQEKVKVLTDENKHLKEEIERLKGEIEYGNESGSQS